jgi:hypothetical protein
MLDILKRRIEFGQERFVDHLAHPVADPYLIVYGTYPVHMSLLVRIGY